MELQLGFSRPARWATVKPVEDRQPEEQQQVHTTFRADCIRELMDCAKMSDAASDVEEPETLANRIGESCGESSWTNQCDDNGNNNVCQVFICNGHI